jgi:hypothetical protein
VHLTKERIQPITRLLVAININETLLVWSGMEFCQWRIEEVGKKHFFFSFRILLMALARLACGKSFSSFSSFYNT